MRYKWKPEDFVVVEHICHEIHEQRKRFVVLLLEKKNRETFDLLDELARRWQIPTKAIGIAGIKDTYAHTFQYISVPAGVKKIVDGKGFSLKSIGYTDIPLSSKSLENNEFSLIVREIPFIIKKSLEKRLAWIIEEGFPNYFDDQRFGSFVDGQWIGKYFFLGKMEEVLRLYIASHFPQDLCQKIQAYWGEWRNCLRLCQESHHREGIRVFSFLAREGHERGFRHAVGLLNHRYLLMAANAYVGMLFNRALSYRVQGDEGISLPTKGGAVFFPSRQASLPKEGWIMAYDAPDGDEHDQQVLKEEEIEKSQLKIRGIYELTIHAKKRALWVIPQMKQIEWEEDECFPGHLKLRLTMMLPPGSYATWVLKLLTQENKNGSFVFHG